jgi:hypothetical protein
MRKLTEKIETLLSWKLGKRTIVQESDELGLHGVKFYNEEPKLAFDGFGDKDALSVNLLLDQGDDNKVRRIERVGGVLIFSQADTYLKSTCFVTGTALVCAKGSKEERDFLESAFASLVEEASEPLRSVMELAQKARVTLNLLPALAAQR